MPISRLFNSAQDAQDAVGKLQQAGYERVHLVTAGTDGDAAALARHGIARDQAKEMAERIGAGAALVIVDAPFGTGADATQILDRAGIGGTSTESGNTASAHHHGQPVDNAAPLSRALGLPVLSRNSAPLSDALGLPVLSRKQSPGGISMGLPTLSDNAAPLSSALHLGTLTRSAAPLSSAVKLPVLSRKAAPLSSLFGMNVLASNPAPLSKLAGWKLLADDPAPLSKLLGLPVLSGDKTHLS